ncbi:MAG: Hsp20/alpha crystallin family protein [Candidatus Lokiarchaeota archaeon]|nr:Hsp20/alpha crystallin family protein [Candidatus Lokiarchaeota archaeon]
MCDDNMFHRSPTGASTHHKSFHGKAHHPGGPIPGYCIPPTGFDMRQIGRMIHRFASGIANNYEGWVPYNLEDKGDSYLVQVPLAGRTKEDVSVSIINKTLNVAAKKPQSTEAIGNEDKKEPPFLRTFFSFVDVNLDIPLPTDANTSEIKSMMQNGLLKVKIGKKPPTNINIDDETSN